MIPEADGDFDNAPNFKFNDDKVKFNTNWVSNTNDNYGSASGFVSKSLLNIRRVDFIHPPSIRPISSTSDWSAIYFLLSSVFTSFISRRKTRRMFSFRLTLSRAGSLSVLFGNNGAIAIERFVEFVRFFEYRDVKIIHRLLNTFYEDL